MDNLSVLNLLPSKGRFGEKIICQVLKMSRLLGRKFCGISWPTVTNECFEHTAKRFGC